MSPGEVRHTPAGPIRARRVRVERKEEVVELELEKEVEALRILDDLPLEQWRNNQLIWLAKCIGHTQVPSRITKDELIALIRGPAPGEERGEERGEEERRKEEEREEEREEEEEVEVESEVEVEKEEGGDEGEEE